LSHRPRKRFGQNCCPRWFFYENYGIHERELGAVDDFDRSSEGHIRGASPIAGGVDRNQVFTNIRAGLRMLNVRRKASYNRVGGVRQNHEKGGFA